MTTEQDQKDFEDFMDHLEDVSEIFKMSDEFLDAMSGKESVTVMGITALTMAKVIFTITSERKEAYSAMAVQFARILEMLDTFYSEQEQQAEEATKQ